MNDIHTYIHIYIYILHTKMDINTYQKNIVTNEYDIDKWEGLRQKGMDNMCVGERVTSF